MKHLPTILLILLCLAASSYAAEKQYQDAVIAKVQQKTDTRTLYYIVNTPITEDDVFYEVTFQSATTAYVTKYTPRHKEDNLPDQWELGSAVKIRTESGRLFVKQADGTEVKLVVMKHRALTPTEQISPPATK